MEATQATRSDGNIHAPRHASSEARGQRPISSPPLIQFMKYGVPVKIALIALKYQGKKESLFVENPAPLWCFVTANCVYWLTIEAVKQLTTLDDEWFKILSQAALASGVLSALSLLSIFIPYPVSLVPLLIWIPLPVILAWPKPYHLAHTGIKGVMDKIHAIVIWAKARYLTEETLPRPPV